MGRAARTNTATGSGVFKKVQQLAVLLRDGHVCVLREAGADLLGKAGGAGDSKNRCTPSANSLSLIHFRIGQNNTASSISGLECAGREESSSQKKHGALRKIHGFSPPCSFVFFIITNILGKSSISGEFIKRNFLQIFSCTGTFFCGRQQIRSCGAPLFCHFRHFAEIQPDLS